MHFESFYQHVQTIPPTAHVSLLWHAGFAELCLRQICAFQEETGWVRRETRCLLFTWVSPYRIINLVVKVLGQVGGGMGLWLVEPLCDCRDASPLPASQRLCTLNQARDQKGSNRWTCPDSTIILGNTWTKPDGSALNWMYKYYHNKEK